ncbi:glycosyltransferase family 4 protein [Paenibacillaceae bacterium WGS1546]|uniref:glycosyltransferase family 4 protein n=1 Tax=Cohnella sp. WGS1546 TaxID=3366810 RepID=UPI00372D7948
MNVLFVFILPSGGVDTLNRIRYKALLPLGIRSHFLYFQHGSGSSGYAPEIPVFYAPDPPSVGHILAHYSFDCIVVTSFFLHLALFRQLGYDKPLLYEIQGFGPPNHARENLSAARPYVNQFANAILYPGTPYIGLLLQELFPLMPRFAFPNPFDPQPYDRRSFAYPPAAPLAYRPIVWIGRLEDNKNWRDFLRIGAEVVRHSPNVMLWMFTDPSLAEPGENEALAQWTERLGLGPYLLHHHNVANELMPYYYELIASSGGVICMTSKAEGAPYVALEALSGGCPVVTSNSDGVGASILDEVTGLYYVHGDIEGAGRQIQRLLSDGNLRKKLVAAGKKHVRREFSMEKYAVRFSDLLFAVGARPC